MPTPEQLSARYARMADQLSELFAKYGDAADPEARAATAVALLHHKMPHYFWTGIYWLKGEDLVVGPYQGPLACAVLERDKGVCWAGVKRNASIVVPDVHAFPGHIACDERSESEVVVPLRNSEGQVVGVFDVDSDKKDAFSNVDARGLELISGLFF